MPDLPFLDTIRAELDDRFTAREIAITGGRAVIRASANAIRALHRQEWDEADAKLADAAAALGEINAATTDQPAMAEAAFVADSAKEYAEAQLTRALFRRHPLPGPEELGIGPVPWLHGLGEAVGELRRRLLDLLRAGDIESAEAVLADMDAIVDELAQLDYPDGMTHGLRRVTDLARSITERSRADLTVTVVQERLRRELDGA